MDTTGVDEFSAAMLQPDHALSAGEAGVVTMHGDSAGIRERPEAVVQVDPFSRGIACDVDQAGIAAAGERIVKHRAGRMIACYDHATVYGTGETRLIDIEIEACHVARARCGYLDQAVIDDRCVVVRASASTLHAIHTGIRCGRGDSQGAVVQE